MTEIEEEMIGSAKSLQVVVEKDLVQETAIQVRVYKASFVTQFSSKQSMKDVPRALFTHLLKPVEWKACTHNHSKYFHC